MNRLFAFLNFALALCLLTACKSTSNALAQESAPFKTFAVYGNSISTYEGYIPKGYAIFYHPSHFPVGKTWWAQLDSLTTMSCIANASWSGSTVATCERHHPESFFTSEGRLKALGANGVPDVIIIVAGTNDWGASLSPLGEYSEGDPMAQTYDLKTFRGAYAHMLKRLREMYPNATLACCALVPRLAGLGRQNRLGYTLGDVNESIAHIAGQFGQPFLNLEECDMHDFAATTYEGLHPNEVGMSAIAHWLAEHIMKISR